VDEEYILDFGLINEVNTTGILPDGTKRITAGNSDVIARMQDEANADPQTGQRMGTRRIKQVKVTRQR
jgi:hypothetical protein